MFYSWFKTQKSYIFDIFKSCIFFATFWNDFKFWIQFEPLRLLLIQSNFQNYWFVNGFVNYCFIRKMKILFLFRKFKMVKMIVYLLFLLVLIYFVHIMCTLTDILYNIYIIVVPIFHREKSLINFFIVIEWPYSKTKGDHSVVYSI